MSGNDRRVVVIGAGFTGLAAAYQLARQGTNVTVVESDSGVGGLAGSFEVGGELLEKFYHHWFTSDSHIVQLIKELGTEERIAYRPTTTGVYVSNSLFKLSGPLDVLRFTPLRLSDRIRLGMLVLRARAIKDWRRLETLTAEEWLLRSGCSEVYRVVWEPLLRNKFGPYASHVSAVWLWNKLRLRGGSRNKKGGEVLAYYRGGFGALAERIAAEIDATGGEIRRNVSATGLIVEAGRVRGVCTSQGNIAADAVIASTALPVVAGLAKEHVPPSYVEQLQRIQYLANICLVLELDRRLSQIYWLNVSEPGFPFVGVIEHTNLESPKTYGGRHIVYLSKYLSRDDPLYQMDERSVMQYCVPHLQRIFPRFEQNWIRAYHLWRAPYAQPVVVRGYGALVPQAETPIPGVYIASMAQIYPEDRGTNYAVRDGRAIAGKVSEFLRRSTKAPQAA